MKPQQMKLLASRFRELAKPHVADIGHQKSLDVIASLAGLRNWPEVVAFPDKVLACRFDGVAIERLVRRSKREFDLTLNEQRVRDGLLSRIGYLETLSANSLQDIGASAHWPAERLSGSYLDYAVAVSSMKFDEVRLVYAPGQHADSVHVWVNGVRDMAFQPSRNVRMASEVLGEHLEPWDERGGSPVEIVEKLRAYVASTLGPMVQLPMPREIYNTYFTQWAWEPVGASVI